MRRVLALAAAAAAAYDDLKEIQLAESRTYSKFGRTGNSLPADLAVELQEAATDRVGTKLRAAFSLCAAHACS